MSVQQISPEELLRLRTAGTAVRLIDVRTPVEFERVHADGAQLVPLDRLDPRAVMSAHGIAADGERVYVICQSGGRSAKACEAFQAAGFPNVASVAGGTAAWERAGLPVVRGTRMVISLERQVRIGAGLLVLLGVLLGWLVHPAFTGLAAFVGAGLVFAGITDWCGMGLLLARMPWNRSGSRADPSTAKCPTSPK